jgi:hypothetical protein
VHSVDLRTDPGPRRAAAWLHLPAALTVVAIVLSAIDPLLLPRPFAGAVLLTSVFGPVPACVCSLMGARVAEHGRLTLLSGLSCVLVGCLCGAFVSIFVVFGLFNV